MENHYSTLGVAENASQEEIKSAYRKLAMQFHPDKNQGNAAAEERFKKISTAYSEIGDPEARARYDQMRQFGGGHPGGNPFQHGGFNFNFEFGGGGMEDIINQFFNQHGFGHPGRQARNKDFTFELHLTLEEAFTGKHTPIQFTVNGQNYNLNVEIPAGIENGTRIRYQGHGDRSIPNAPPGDLYINVLILNHAVFRRNGANLHTEITVDALSAIIGCDHTLTCIDGQKVRLTIPEGTQPDTNLKISGRGMPLRGNGHARGDCIVTVKITVPTGLDNSLKQKIRELVDQRTT